MIATQGSSCSGSGMQHCDQTCHETPLSAFAMAELAERAGVPAGVINLLVGRRASEAIGGELTANPIVRKLTFTGSTPVGKHAGSAVCRHHEENLHGIGWQRAVYRVR